MLAWIVEEVESPYGTVATMHWAVPDETEDGSDLAIDSACTELQVQLESAEDQLGAVLWNSNSAALSYLHTHVFGLPPVTSTTENSGSESEAVAKARAFFSGKNIVELGAGVGCLGIALAMAGARVAVTDMKELLPLMEYNVRLNAQRVHTRSGGVGRCVELQWKWGPTVTTSVHKQLQKKVAALTKVASSSSSATPSPLEGAVKTVMTSMVAALEKPSDSLLACSAALSTTRPLPFHYVIMCDALYGNPKDWPALLYTLTELLATNPDTCEVVNFCEQRVNDVEGAFLKLLDEENAKVYVAPAERESTADPLWRAVTDTAAVCAAALVSAAATEDTKKAASSGATSSSAAAVEMHKAREEAASALLSYVLVQRRGHYRWSYTTEVVAEAQSELNMVIRATRIRWTRVDGVTPASGASADPEKTRRRAREADASPSSSSTSAAKKAKKHH